MSCRSLLNMAVFSGLVEEEVVALCTRGSVSLEEREGPYQASSQQQFNVTVTRGSLSAANALIRWTDLSVSR